MAPPFPPCPEFAPCPTAEFSEKRLFRMFHETPMLLSAPPFAHELPRPCAPPNVLLTIQTVRLVQAPSATMWSSFRIAPPPTSDPSSSHTLFKKLVFTTLRLPPSA